MVRPSVIRTPINNSLFIVATDLLLVFESFPERQTDLPCIRA